MTNNHKEVVQVKFSQTFWLDNHPVTA